MRRRKMREAALTNKTSIRVRFSEVDSMAVVWHGEYVRYMEDGRESFGREYQIGYMGIVREGYLVPIVELDMKYKQFLKYDELVTIETRFIPTDAAKIIFDFIIYRESTGEIVATGSTTQVFVSKDTELL